MATGDDAAGWLWLDLDEPLDRRAAARGPDEVIAAHEALLRISDAPLDARPRTRLSGGVSPLLRYVDDGDLRVVFLVTHPIVADGLRLIALMAR
ncbi:hypothetical protein [Candidatus Poriferisodalis sp.]|uniref:hypothetical protein n=1 Tax=Candidatus Poriferisodalis sp. TaxID=3101277 RepID=UPI003B52238C